MKRYFPILGTERRKCTLCDWKDTRRKGGDNNQGVYVGSLFYCPPHAREFYLVDGKWVRLGHENGDKSLDNIENGSKMEGNERQTEDSELGGSTYRRIEDKHTQQEDSKIQVGAT